LLSIDFTINFIDSKKWTQKFFIFEKKKFWKKIYAKNEHFAIPSFTKNSTIEFFFDSKVKKVLLLIFFKIKKMKKNGDHFFGKLNLKIFHFFNFKKI
jgi:hypothetical protein